MSIIPLVKSILVFVLVSLRSLAHPENPREWRAAWVYFVMPASYFIVFGIAMTWLILWLIPWTVMDWIVGTVWIVYIWICEPMMYYADPGIGWERARRWIAGEKVE